MFPSPFQSTHPLRGATSGQLIKIAALHISIPAPLTGCDVGCRSPPYQSFLFQSTPPSQGATTVSVYASTGFSAFQSTHPSRGATGIEAAQALLPHISIHAPLTGCDGHRRRRHRDRMKFQSTHPSRGATTRLDAVAGRAIISIHAPLAGCDPGDAGDLYALWGISIHAPLAGCDVAPFHARVGHTHFNPRTPCGVRQREQNFLRFLVSFQSTRPSRGATSSAAAF